MKKQANHSTFIYHFFIFRVPSSAFHPATQNNTPERLINIFLLIP